MQRPHRLLAVVEHFPQPPGFSASIIWHFRIATLGTHAVLYATLGLAFGALAERWITQATRGAADTYRTSSPSAGALRS